MLKYLVGLVLGSVMSLWNANANACSRPDTPRSVVAFGDLETPEIPRNGAIVVRTNTSLGPGDSVTATVLIDGKEVAGTVKPWPERHYFPRIAWVPNAPLPANAQLSVRLDSRSFGGTDVFQGVVKTTAESAPDISVGSISIRAEERGHEIVDNCEDTCDTECEVVGTRYNTWAIISVPQPTGGFTVGGYQLVPVVDPSGEYHDVQIAADVYSTFSEGGNLQLEVFLPPSKQAYRPCFAVEVQALSGKKRTAPVCLPSSKYEERQEDAGCSISHARGNGAAWYGVCLAAAAMLVCRARARTSAARSQSPR
jgi:hypothetical protein